MKNELSLQEINGVAIDVVFAGVDTVSIFNVSKILLWVKVRYIFMV